MSITISLPRFPLAFLPTPVHPLPRLSAALAEQRSKSAIRNSDPKINLWIKRDDQTGLAGGGNKTRKLEFLIADALAQGADTVLTTGAVQSNHCRQTAAAAVKAGVACHLVLGGNPPAQANGNLLLDQLLGAELHWTARENRLARLAELAEELRAQGHRPYPITYGGSDPVGASGYALALEELWTQVRAVGLRLDAIVVASSSGGTQAGLVAGAWALGWDVPILGISIDEPEADLRAKVADLATGTAARLGCPHTFRPGDIRVSAGYLGGGYGVLGILEGETIRLLARTEGILLDPVYTARAFGGLLDLIRARSQAVCPACGTQVREPAEEFDKRFGSGTHNVLFWHTGGTPALFAYAGELMQ